MTERSDDLTSFPSYRAPRRSLFSARKFALMASVVAGLGVAAYGLSPQHAPADPFMARTPLRQRRDGIVASSQKLSASVLELRLQRRPGA